MRRLHLLRHAKSSWADGAASDRERGLNKRGRRDAPRMGEALAQLLDPQPVHASPARRAQLTLGGLCDGWPALQEIDHSTVEALYTFDAGAVLHWLHGQAGAPESLFLIGHNPAFTELVNMLCPDAELLNLPTAGYAGMELDIDDWADASPGCGHLRHLLIPKEL